MTWLALAIAALILLIVLMYARAPGIAWLLAGGAWFFTAAELTEGWNIPLMICGGLWVLGNLALMLPPLRRAIFSGPMLAVYKRILPAMSQTEREALEAGSVWWEGELFSGAPNWTRLHDMPQPKLTAEELAFLDNEVEQVCAMTDDWEVSHTHQDLPPNVWQYLKDHGFLGMIIPKKYGGLEFSAYMHSQVVMQLSTRCSALAVQVMVCLLYTSDAADE